MKKCKFCFQKIDKNLSICPFCYKKIYLYDELYELFFNLFFVNCIFYIFVFFIKNLNYYEKGLFFLWIFPYIVLLKYIVDNFKKIKHEHKKK